MLFDLAQKGYLMLPADKFWFLSYVLLSESDAKVVSAIFLHLNSELNLRIPHGGYCRQRCLQFCLREALQGHMFFLLGEELIIRSNNEISTGGIAYRTLVPFGTFQ